MQTSILADGRWQGAHGIGRFSKEVLSRLTDTTILTKGPAPLSLKNLWWLPRELNRKRHEFKIYFNPGFNAVLTHAMPYVLTIHDLTHLHFPGNLAYLKKFYYTTLLKKSAQNANHIVTVSEFSKQDITQWANIPPENITVVGNGVSHSFKLAGQCYEPGFPYFLHVGNSKAHKNINRLMVAFAQANIDKIFHLILTTHATAELNKLAEKLKLGKRIHFMTKLNDENLAALYRGATALVLPSLYEGFGIPVIEAMSCGAPVITSNITSLPEVAGNAALLIDPYETKSITLAMEKITHDIRYRDQLIQQGLQQAKKFSWDQTATLIQNKLLEL